MQGKACTSEFLRGDRTRQRSDRGGPSCSPQETRNALNPEDRIPRSRIPRSGLPTMRRTRLRVGPPTAGRRGAGPSETSLRTSIWAGALPVLQRALRFLGSASTCGCKRLPGCSSLDVRLGSQGPLFSSSASRERSAPEREIVTENRLSGGAAARAASRTCRLRNHLRNTFMYDSPVLISPRLSECIASGADLGRRGWGLRRAPRRP